MTNASIKKHTLEKTAVVTQSVYNMYHYLNHFTKPLNESKIFAGIMIIILNLTTKHVNWNLPKPIESYLKFTFSRNILIFAICWMGSRDILVSLVLTLFFILVMDYILNDSSSYCCLPEGFINYYKEQLEKEKADKNQPNQPPIPVKTPVSNDKTENQTVKNSQAYTLLSTGNV